MRIQGVPICILLDIIGFRNSDFKTIILLYLCSTHNRDIKSDMGNAPPAAKKPTMEDTLIEMKMASKRMGRESTKSMKESQQYMKKAKEALKKNNE